MEEQKDGQQVFGIFDGVITEPQPQSEEVGISIVIEEPIIGDDILILDDREFSMVTNLDENIDESSQLKTNLSDVMELLENINKKFDDKIAVDTNKNQLFDKMYSELQSLKDDPYRKTLKPIFMDLITFIDSTRNLVSRYPQEPLAENLLEVYQRLRNELSKVSGHIEDLLYNHGIEPFVSDNMSDFDPKTQQARKTTVVESDQDNKKVIESLSPGYNWDNQLLRKESVNIGIKNNTNN